MKSPIECMIEVDGVYLLASVAKDCVAEWGRILTAGGLPIAPIRT